MNIGAISSLPPLTATTGLCDADRFAWLREEARIAGGSIRLTDEQCEWIAERKDLLSRFGLEFSLEESRLRLHIHESLARALPAFLQATRRDDNLRNAYEEAFADPLLLRHTAFTTYRSAAQKSVIRAIATMPEGSSAIVNMPTGGGKSLVFQLLARLMRDEKPTSGIVVIVPTIALALDHQRTLRAMEGLQGSKAISGDTTAVERDEALTGFLRGEVPILIMSPEAFIRRFDTFQRAADPKDVAKDFAPGSLDAIVIDEAHIIEQWGRKFRPDFQRLPNFIDRLRTANPALRTVLLSATIDPNARGLLTSRFGSALWREIGASKPRYEFDFLTKSFHDEGERTAVVDLVVDHAPRPAIVYTTEIRKAEAIHRRLQDRGYQRLALFTGRTADADRQAVIDRWSKGDLDLVVATSAFGMGIDKANVRAVIHACLPESVSRFYQEIGRAGRDGHQALSVLLWTKGAEAGTDRRVAASMRTSDLLTTEVAKKRWRALLHPSSRQNDDPETGRHLIAVDLEAAHEDIDHGDTDSNRSWNAGLLMLLQRTGLLTVMAGSDITKKGSHIWLIRIDDERLLSPDQGDVNHIWTLYDSARSEELQTGRAELENFVALAEGRSGCMLVGAFEAIEPDAKAFPPCGRCDHCRRLGIEPSRITSHPVEAAPWPVSLTQSLLDQQGLQIVYGSNDDIAERLPGIVDHFVGAGFRQFVATTDLAGRMVAQLKGVAAPSFVSTWEEDLSIAKQMPTVFFAPEGQHVGDWWPRVDEARLSRPRWPYVLLMPRDVLLSGKPATSASILAPLSLDALFSSVEP